MVIETSDKSRYQKSTPMVIEVKKWKYSKPPHVPEGQKEFTHLCGCREYEEDGVWHLRQCSKHKTETDALIERLRKKMGCTT